MVQNLCAVKRVFTIGVNEEPLKESHSVVRGLLSAEVKEFASCIQKQAAAVNFTFPIRTLKKYDPLWFVFKSFNCSTEAETVREQGLKCVKFTEKTWSRSEDKLRETENQYTVCPERDYSLVKWAVVHSESGAVHFEMNIEHQQDTQLGVWIPKKWTIVDPGTRMRSEESIVTSYDLNIEIADEEFLQ